MGAATAAKGKWEISQLPAHKDHLALGPANLPEVVAVTAIGRYGNASLPTVYGLGRSEDALSSVIEN